MNSRKKNSILIVDDERSNISTLNTILNSVYIIYASNNGKEAIETALEFMPDIILLDVLMPEMDGYDVIATLKNYEKTRNIPVIFITGLDNINAEIKGLSSGAVDYIQKPFNSAIVRLRIQNQIQIVERLRQQTLITKISHNFLSNAYTGSLYAETLRMVGEFMGIATILLYTLKEENNLLTCQNEWINPELNLNSRIGDKIQLNEQTVSAINNLLSENEKDLCLHSNNPVISNYTNLSRNYLNNFVTTPVFIKGKMCAILVFYNKDNSEWSKSDIDLATLVTNIFSVVFERDAINSDLIKIQELEASLIAAKEHAEYLSRAKSEFLSRMSHEMRTPMNAIIGMLQVFEIQGIPDNMRKSCEAMNNAAKDLQRLINDVLDVSDIEYGAFKLSDSVFNYRNILKDVLMAADDKATEKRQMLNCKTDPAIPASLCGDERHLKLVISTLLSNAVKYTPEDGEIYFEARLINKEDNTITLQIEISDNGIGISKERQDKLFSLFEQEDGSFNRKDSGIGIGLALSKRIAEMMGGNIWVESELGKGAKFYFTCVLQLTKSL